MRRSRPIAVDLFSGAGGMSLGFEQAGFDVAAAVDIDPIHMAVHSYNFPNAKVLPKSVVGLRAAEIRSASAIGDGKITVVFGGAPCQGFSLIGYRQLEDPRNALVREFVRLVGELDSDYAVFENVKGLTVGRHRDFLGELISEFDRWGYAVRLQWRVLNASHFGVPQHRERLFLMAAKKDLPVPKYPERAGGRVSCADALADLPDIDAYPELQHRDFVRLSNWAEPSAYAREMRCLTNKAWHYGYPREWDPQVLTSSLRTKHTAISVRRFAATQPGEVEPISRFFKLAPDGLCNTLRAGTDSSRGAFTSPRPIHYAYPRCISVREMMRLHGFPDWFRMHVTKWHGARQVGNAVPPPLARVVAAEVLAAAGIKPMRPRQVVKLGGEGLLQVDMAESLKLFGLAAPPFGGRNRKSGLRKRKQSEIEALLISG